MNIYLFIGSFKPPHKGHYNNIIEIINNKNFNIDKDKIMIIIGKNNRPLDNEVLNYKNKSKEILYNIVKKYKKNIKDIKEYKKEELKEIIGKNIEKGIIRTITQKQSYKIWKIYIKYIKKIYDKVKIEIKESKNISPLLNIKYYIKKEYEKIYLIKSEKNISNKRFNFIKNDKIEKYITKEIENISSTKFRESILNKNKIEKYLPKILDEKDIKSIYKILS